MTMLTMSMHPSDEALSRLADQSEIERMRSRAGRHLVRCDRCQAEVAAIGTLGNAARAIPEPALPPSLGERIAERRRSEGAISDPAVAPVLGAPAERAQANPGQRAAKRWTMGGIAAAIALIALVVPTWRHHTLAAASNGEASIYPRYPRPGATLGVRFVPKAGWRGGDTLWAWGVIDLGGAPRDGHRVTWVSIGAPLVRDGDGDYRGRVVLPDDALSGALNIQATVGPAMLPQSLAKLVVLTGTASGDRPSLDALESAVYNDRYFFNSPVLADAFARWAPSHPMRWLVDDAARRRRRSFNWMRFFDSEERRFARLTAQLNSRSDVRPAEIAGMAGLAYRIEEPAVAAEWTDRLLREHPDDPWALDLRLQQIHEMELRSAPVDSIALLIPSLDSLYPTSRLGGALLYGVTVIVDRYADAATQRRWKLRAARGGRIESFGYLGESPDFDDPELRDSIAAFAREMVSRGPAPARWNGSMNLPNPELQRAVGYSRLASVALARHDYRLAAAQSDSARISGCVWPAQGTKARALLALGDTAAALPLLAAFARGPHPVVPDSARRLLGSRFNPPRWQATVDSVERARLACRRQRT